MSSEFGLEASICAIMLYQFSPRVSGDIYLEACYEKLSAKNQLGQIFFISLAEGLVAREVRVHRMAESLIA